MGTRGAVGWIENGKWQGVYNHFDSYPEGLGAAIFKLVKEKGISTVIEELKKHNEWSDFVENKEPPESPEHFESTDEAWDATAEWIYTLLPEEGRIKVEGYMSNLTMFIDINADKPTLQSESLDLGGE